MRSLTRLFALTLTSGALVLTPGVAHAATPGPPSTTVTSSMTTAASSLVPAPGPACWDW